MKNMSVDCDCCAVAKDPCMADIGVLTSLDPVAIDKACLDLVYASDDEGKAHLMVFDFVDNASQYNAPYSMHRLFKLKDYHAGGTVLGRKGDREAEADLYAKGERPDAVIDYPVDATDYEIVDIFNWQEEAAGMISQMEFIRRVDAASETVERYIREGEIIPDLIVPMSEHRTFKYFTEEIPDDVTFLSSFTSSVVEPEIRTELVT